MSRKRLMFIIVAIVAMTALFLVGCSDKPGKSTNPADVVSALSLDESPSRTDYPIYGLSYDYYNTDGGDIYVIDVETMTSTLLFETGLNPDENVYPNGIGYDSVNDRLYYVSGVPGDQFQLYFYDIAGDMQYVAGNVTGTIADGVWYDGAYYYIPQATDNLYKVTFDGSGYIAANTLVAEDFTGNTKSYTFGDVEAANGKLYGSAWDGNTNAPSSEYFMINLDSGNYEYEFLFYSTIQPTAPAFQLAWGPDYVLYAHDTGGGHWYEVDLDNETETYMGQLTGEYENFTDITSFVEVPPPPPEWVIFGASFDVNNVDGDDLYSINIDDMTSTLIQETGMNPDTTTWPNGLAYDPDNERLYFTTVMPNELYGYDLNTDTQWYAGDVTGSLACGAWWDGHYYYIPQGTDNLYMVSFNAAGMMTANTMVAQDFTGSNKVYTFGDIVALDGILYGSAWDSNNNSPSSEYFTIDLATGGYTYNFLFYSSVMPALQLAFGADAVLYAHDTGAGMFYEVDLVTETETPIGPLSGQYTNFTDLASGPAPQVPTLHKKRGR